MVLVSFSLVRSLLHASSLASESGCAGRMFNQMLIWVLHEVLGCFCIRQGRRADAVVQLQLSSAGAGGDAGRKMSAVYS